jgi:hypothetical protein
MPDNDNLAALRRTTAALQATYDRAREDIVQELEHSGAAEAFQPEEIRDPTGRYILLDALTALVQANTVLAAADNDH